MKLSPTTLPLFIFGLVCMIDQCEAADFGSITSLQQQIVESIDSKKSQKTVHNGIKNDSSGKNTEDLLSNILPNDLIEITKSMKDLQKDIDNIKKNAKKVNDILKVIVLEIDTIDNIKERVANIKKRITSYAIYSITVIAILQVSIVVLVMYNSIICNKIYKEMLIKN